MTQAAAAKIKVSLQPVGGGVLISPLLFGQNLEHTRRCIQGGLSAQVLRNRKFCGQPETDGAPLEWYAIGSRRCLVRIEPQQNIWQQPVSRQHVFVRHHDHTPGEWEFSAQSAKVESFGHEPCGIGQDRVPLVAGKEYELRLALEVDRPLTARVRLCDLRYERCYYESQIKLAPGQWQEYQWRFTAAESDKYARFEITIEEPGTLWIGATALLPAGHFHGMRSDVIDLLGRLGITWLRWPGGNFAGDYRWKDGLLPVDRRAGLKGFDAGTLRFTNNHDEHEIGIDEYIAVCRRIGCEPCLTINVSLEGPKEAAEWVEYCNGPADSTWGKVRAGRGHPEPFRVKYWSLGNEMGYGHMAGPNGVIEYLRVARACADAMKRVDPDLVFIASGTWTGQWIEQVPADAYSFFDHVSYHRYVKPVDTYHGAAAGEEIARLLRTPLEERQRVQDCGSSLEKHLPAGRRVGISFDEWNIWWAWLQSPLAVDGIYAAGFMNMLCRDAHRIGIDLAAFFEPVNEGAILVTGDSARLTPIGQVFELFKAHQGGTLLDTGPDVTQDVNVCASVSATGDAVHATIVNRQVDQSAEVTIELPAGAKSVSTTLLAADGEAPWPEFATKSQQRRVESGSTFTVNLPRISVMLVRVQL